jgi:hypothetical protein
MMFAPYHGMSTFFSALLEGYGWQSFKMAWESMMMDITEPNTHSPLAKYTAMHGMLGYLPEFAMYETPEEGRARAKNYMLSQKERHPGKGCHTAEDLVTPWHMGRPWHEWKGLNPFRGNNAEIVLHYFEDAFLSPVVMPKAIREGRQYLRIGK